VFIVHQLILISCQFQDHNQTNLNQDLYTSNGLFRIFGLGQGR